MEAFGAIVICHNCVAKKLRLDANSSLAPSSLSCVKRGEFLHLVGSGAEPQPLMILVPFQIKKKGFDAITIYRNVLHRRSQEIEFGGHSES